MAVVAVGALLLGTCAPQVSQALRSPGSSCSAAPVRLGAVRPTFPGCAGLRRPHARLARGRGGFRGWAGAGD